MPQIQMEEDGDRVRVRIDAEASYEDWLAFCRRLDAGTFSFAGRPVVVDCGNVDHLPSTAYAAIFTIAYLTQEAGGDCTILNASDAIRRNMDQVGFASFACFADDEAAGDWETSLSRALADLDPKLAALEPKRLDEDDDDWPE